MWLHYISTVVARWEGNPAVVSCLGIEQLVYENGVYIGTCG